MATYATSLPKSVDEVYNSINESYTDEYSKQKNFLPGTQMSLPYFFEQAEAGSNPLASQGGTRFGYQDFLNVRSQHPQWSDQQILDVMGNVYANAPAGESSAVGPQGGWFTGNPSGQASNYWQQVLQQLGYSDPGLAAKAQQEAQVQAPITQTAIQQRNQGLSAEAMFALGALGMLGGAWGAGAFGAGGAGAAAPAAGAVAPAAAGSGSITGISNIASALASGATPAVGAGAGEALGMLGGAGAAFGVGPGVAIPATGAAFGAVPLSAAELANVAQGINAFAGSGMPAGSYQAQTGQLPSAPSGGGPGTGTGLQAPQNAQFGTQGLSPAGQQALGLPPTSPTAPAAAGAPTGVPGVPAGIPGGTDVVSDIINQLKKNALSLGLMGASLLGAGSKADELPPAAGELRTETQGARDIADEYINAARQGKLTPPQQASLDQYVQNAKNQVRQYFAGIGQFDSTSRLQAEAEIDRTGLAMQQQIISTTLSQGLKALEIGTGPLQQIANYQAGQDQALIQAMGQFAQGIGGLFGQEAGRGTTTGTTR